MKYFLPKGTIVRRWRDGQNTWSMPLPTERPVTFDENDVLEESLPDEFADVWLVFLLPENALPYLKIRVNKKNIAPQLSSQDPKWKEWFDETRERNAASGFVGTLSHDDWIDKVVDPQ